MATDAKKKNTKKKPIAAEDKKVKKAHEIEEAPVGTKKQKQEKASPQQPRSAKLLHQFIPFIFFAIAVLIATCLIAVKAFSADMGVAGNLIATVLCGLFGFGAFFLPVILVFIGSLWHRIIDDNKVGIKTILSTLAVLMFSIIIHVFFINGSTEANFNAIDLWNKGSSLFGGGLLGGLLAELLCLLFKHLGTIIITITCLAIVLMSIFELTPKNIVTFIKYRRKLARERKEERLALAREEEERLAAEREQEEKERKAEEIRRRVREEQKGAAMTVSDEKLDGSAASVLGETEEKPEEKKLPEVIILEPGKPKEEKSHDDDDCVPMSKIFSDDYVAKKNADGIVAIDLPSNKDKAKKAPAAQVIEKPKEKKKEISLSMKVDTEELSELESLRGGDGVAEAIVKPSYVYPPISLLNEDTNPKGADVSDEMNENAAILRETLASFNIGIKDQILCSRGPTITRYELRPEVGIRVRSIANLIDDISLSLATSGVRIEAPIPNKPYVGIEVPNRNRLTVFLRSLIENEKFVGDSSKLTACLGSDVGGHPVFFDISKMPHLLIAGATGMGKSVCINSIIISLLYKASPDEVKLILIDPKKVEFNVYKDIPHLYAPIVSDPKKAAGALASAVAEMERRFELIEEVGVRDINNYNAITADDPEREYLPKMVIIIDELADLMMTAPGEVESSICRLAQKARAAGIHIIIGTQRPSVDVITGLIKANIPSRIACTVASQVDSRTIIDIAGAEKLIGKGDMLFAPVGLSKPMRVQGCFVSDAEVEAVVEFIKDHNSKAEYNKDFISLMESEAAKCGQPKKGGGSDGGDDGGESDPKFREAVKLAIDAGKISTSLLQRMIGVGYGRAAKLIDKMEAMGYVSAPDGNKPRRVLITMQEYMEKVINDDIDSGNDSEGDEE